MPVVMNKLCGLAARSVASCKFLTMDRLDNVEALPSGNDLLQEDAFVVLCEAMGLHRDYCGLLRKALSQMYVESFNVSSATNSSS